MERYGGRGSVPVEGLQSDPVPETGLEESMWNLGLGDDGDVSGELAYPERPDEADCIYFLRTGFCGYGHRCRFNHPRDRSSAIGAIRPGRGGYPERIGQPVCQYFMRTGMCKFGASCKYHHPRQGGGSLVSVNYLGYPLRPGEQECNYYMKTGLCKFGGSCKFHHPQPDGTQVSAASQAPGAAAANANVPASYSTMQSPSGPSSQQYGMMAGSWQMARPAPLMPGAYMQGYGPVMLSPGMVPFAGWNPYPAPVYPVTASSMQSTVGSGPFYGITQLSPSAPAYKGAYPLISSSLSPNKELTYPERPGQPECQFYLKTGECKFGSSCRYHHPREMVTPPTTSIALSPMNLPLRPGVPPCSYYAQHGVCKFGPTCKYDHPMGGTLSYSPSASSLADMPVAPYPVGSSSLGTLAASSSSTDLQRTEPATSRSSNSSPTTTTRMSLSTGSSSSVGPIRSQDDQTPHSAPSTGNIS